MDGQEVRLLVGEAVEPGDDLLCQAQGEGEISSNRLRSTSGRDSPL